MAVTRNSIQFLYFKFISLSPLYLSLSLPLSSLSLSPFAKVCSFQSKSSRETITEGYPSTVCVWRKFQFLFACLFWNPVFLSVLYFSLHYRLSSFWCSIYSSHYWLLRYIFLSYFSPSPTLPSTISTSQFRYVGSLITPCVLRFWRCRPHTAKLLLLHR